MRRTRAIELLTQAGVSHTVCAFDARDFTAVEAAAALGISVGMVCKTLVVRGERSGVLLAVLPGDRTLDLRKLAGVLDEKRVEFVGAQELPRLTGYHKGGVSPLGGRRTLPVVIDESAVDKEVISISAGVRGVQILLAPRDLIRVTEATVADISVGEASAAPHDA